MLPRTIVTAPGSSIALMAFNMEWAAGLDCSSIQSLSVALSQGTQFVVSLQRFQRRRLPFPTLLGFILLPLRPFLRPPAIPIVQARQRRRGPLLPRPRDPLLRPLNGQLPRTGQRPNAKAQLRGQPQPTDQPPNVKVLLRGQLQPTDQRLNAKAPPRGQPQPTGQRLNGRVPPNARALPTGQPLNGRVPLNAKALPTSLQPNRRALPRKRPRLRRPL